MKTKDIIFTIHRTGNHYRQKMATSGDYYSIELEPRPDELTADEWAWLVEIAEYGLNEEGDMTRHVPADLDADGAQFPEFTYQVV